MAFTDFSKYKVLKSSSILNYNEPGKEKSCRSSEFSSAYISPDASLNCNNKKKSLDVCNLQRDQFDSFDLSNVRVKIPPNVWNDPWATSDSKYDKSSPWCSSSFSSAFNGQHVNVKENLAPTESHTNTSTTFFNDFTYAPLSNYDSFYDESICKFSS